MVSQHSCTDVAYHHNDFTPLDSATSPPSPSSYLIELSNTSRQHPQTPSLSEQVWVVPPKRLLLDDVAIQHNRSTTSPDHRCPILFDLGHKLLLLPYDHRTLHDRFKPTFIPAVRLRCADLYAETEGVRQVLLSEKRWRIIAKLQLRSEWRI